jgi:hypothetical protein
LIKFYKGQMTHDIWMALTPHEASLKTSKETRQLKAFPRRKFAVKAWNVGMVLYFNFTTVNVVKPCQWVVFSFASIK